MRNVLILDFYDTVVTRHNTEEGYSYFNIKPNFPMWEAIKLMDPDYIFIVENESFADKAEMRGYQFMYEYYRRALAVYLDGQNTFVEYNFCPFEDSDPEYRKPNIGIYRSMFVKILKADNTAPFSDPDTQVVVVGHETDRLIAQKIGAKFAHTDEVLGHVCA